jgi:hypothetical protein
LSYTVNMLIPTSKLVQSLLFLGTAAEAFASSSKSSSTAVSKSTTSSTSRSPTAAGAANGTKTYYIDFINNSGTDSNYSFFLAPPAVQNPPNSSVWSNELFGVE